MKANQIPVAGSVVMLSKGIWVHPGIPFKFFAVEDYLHNDNNSFNDLCFCNIKSMREGIRIGKEIKFCNSRKQKKAVEEYLVSCLTKPVGHLAESFTDAQKSMIRAEVGQCVKKIIPLLKQTFCVPEGEYVVIFSGMVTYDVGVFQPVYKNVHEMHLSKILEDGSYNKDEFIVIHYKGCPPLKVLRKIEIKAEPKKE